MPFGHLASGDLLQPRGELVATARANQAAKDERQCLRRGDNATQLGEPPQTLALLIGNAGVLRVDQQPTTLVRCQRPGRRMPTIHATTGLFPPRLHESLHRAYSAGEAHRGNLLM